MAKYLLVLILCFLFLTGCAVQQQTVQERVPVAIPIPVGIDSTTSAIADSIFYLTAVVERDEAEAKKFFEQAQQLRNFIDIIWKTRVNGNCSAEDSAKTLSALNDVDIYLKTNPEEYKRIHKLSKKYGRLHQDVLEIISRILISQTSSVFETCLRKNKFRVEYRRQYSQFLNDSYQKLKDKSLLQRSAEELEKIISENKNNRVLYSDLGAIYWDLGNWQKSFENYGEAKTALIKNAIFEIENPHLSYDSLEQVPVDTNRLVTYLSRQADSKIKLYEDKPALALLEQAQALTPNEQYKIGFGNKITWINWDAGNIRAAEIRDHADSLWHVKENPAAAKLVYLELLPLLRLKRTRDQINWNIANIDFYHLENRDAGVSRMQTLRTDTSVDSLTGAPLDSTYRRYFDTYGAMCFQLGTQYLKADLQYAYIYFCQAAKINFKDRAKAYLQLADMCKFDPHETIRLCNKSLECNGTMDESSKKILYHLLSASYKKLGDFETSKKWYDLWRQL